MTPNRFKHLSSLTEEAMVRLHGWNTFLEFKVETWRRTDAAFRNRCGLLEFLGMTEDEYADWVLSDRLHPRVRRAWGFGPAVLAEDPRFPARRQGW